MQVQNGLAGAVARAYGSQPGGRTSTASSTGGRTADTAGRSDSVGISATLQEVGRVRSSVAAAPESRAHRVAALRSEVASGRYQVDTVAVAGALLGMAE